MIKTSIWTPKACFLVFVCNCINELFLKQGFRDFTLLKFLIALRHPVQSQFIKHPLGTESW